MRGEQQASQMTQNAQQASSEPFGAQCFRCGAATPKFSLKPGKYSGPLTVKIRDASRGAVIYYTTDGWTPTADSARYTGPIAVDATTSFQAIAISPSGGRSRVAKAAYTLNGVPAAASAGQTSLQTSSQTSLQTMDGPNLVPANPESANPASASERLILARGTAVPLVFTRNVSSRTADVGDKISLVLADDLKAGNVIVVKKGTTSTATIVQVDRPSFGGLPGEVFFQADSLKAGDAVVRLRGSAAKEGQDKEIKAALVPAGGLMRGKDAEIVQGTLFTAFVDADTLLPPAN